MEDKIKVVRIHYKLSKTTNKVSAFKIEYNHGVQTPLLKAKNETEDDMQTVTLAKKQSIAKYMLKPVNKTTMECRFMDQNDMIILRFQYHWPLPKNKYGQQDEDLLILTDNFFMYYACERHDNELHCFCCLPINGEWMNWLIYSTHFFSNVLMKTQ